MTGSSPDPAQDEKSRLAERAKTSADGTSQDPIQAILNVLRAGQRFLICSHARPDGDAVASSLALSMLLDQMGKQAVTVSADPVPDIYRRLPGAERIRVVQHASGQFDAAILLECDGPKRAEIEGLDHYFLINIDHHLSGRGYAQLNWIDEHAPSVGEMVYRLVKAAGAKLTPEMATCLFTTLLTDTGGFRYGAVNAATFGLARELTQAGADPVRIAEDVYFSSHMSKMLLLGAALTNLKRKGRVAWLWVTQDDMMRACATAEDCEGIVNYALGIEGIQAAVFLRELPDGQVRVSLRSKGRVNVAQVAARLGGGGHKNAAGCTVAGPLDRAIEEMPALLRVDLKSAPETAPGRD